MNRKKINVYKKRIEQLIGDEKFSRLGRTFQTKQFKYYYDTGTGKVFRIKEDIFLILQSLIKTDTFDDIFTLGINENEILEALEELFAAVDKENILKAFPVIELSGRHIYDLEKLLKHKRNQILLEVTEDCNMRCKYCLYHYGKSAFRGFGYQEMTFEVAKKAIDQLMDETDRDNIFVSFYGGEPLLKYDLIKECISYCQEKYSNRPIVYSMTTNATLITKEVASYLSNVGVLITVSLDGPASVHDKYRVFGDGSGSFGKALTGLKCLVDAYKDEADKRLMINSVVTDYDEETLIKTQEFFNTLDWLPKGINHMSSYVDEGPEAVEYEGIDSDYEEKVRGLSDNDERAFIPIENWGSKKARNGSSEELEFESLAREGLNKRLFTIHRRLLCDTPVQKYGFNGCCVPGEKKVYVTAKGSYLVCEKMGPSPDIGNVYSGIDVEKIREFYVERFRKEAVKYCKNCWAINLCTLCYTDCYIEDDINLNNRHRTCELHRISIEKVLALYHHILEKAPKSLEFLNEYEIL